MKVAAAQIKVTNNADKNLEKILEYLKKASSKKVKIVCFPETCLIKSKEIKKIKKIPIIYYLEKIKQSCRKNKIYCIFGSNSYSNNKIYNSAFLIDKKGRLLYKYNKVNLWKSEKKHKVANGNKNKVIKTEFGKIGIIICWDIAYSESIRELAKKGAWLIFCPSYIKNYGREVEPYLQIPLVRAFENTSYIVFCDAYAKDTIKYSCICSPSKIITKIQNKEGLIVADLDRRKIVGFRKYYNLI